MRLILEDISHAYGTTTALDHIDLAVGEGEIVALIGPSGCGKSTLLGIIGGILEPSSGRARIEGALPVDSLNPFTFVFQDFALLPWRSVAANVSLPLEHHRLERAEQAALVADALARTGLTEFADALPKQLSGGMRQRVGIARALVVRPALLLMDEPLSALDAQTRDLLMEDFLDLWVRNRIGAVYVTHNLTEAIRLADRIVVLSRRPGRIREIVPVPISQGERGTLGAQAELAGLHERLWSLIRDEARAADRALDQVANG
jgi:NitT/TauT family transport system ATP-binding protein